MPHLDPITLASLIGAACLALTRLFTTAKPVWDKLPAPLQGLLPMLVLVLPQLAEQAAGVKTGLDLVNLVVLAIALVLPGYHSHTIATSKPSGPSSGVLMGALVFCLSFGAGLACSHGLILNWPKLGACLDPLRPGLVQIVADVLAGNGDAEQDLATLGKTEGLEAVECAVKQLVSDVGKQPAEARGSRIRARGQAFLVTVPK
jgi:hypothetical protein